MVFFQPPDTCRTPTTLSTCTQDLFSSKPDIFAHFIKFTQSQQPIQSLYLTPRPVLIPGPPRFFVFSSGGAREEFMGCWLVYCLLLPRCTNLVLSTWLPSSCSSSPPRWDNHLHCYHLMSSQGRC